MSLTKEIPEKKVNQIYHNHLVKNFVGLEKIIEKYLNDRI